MNIPIKPKGYIKLKIDWFKVKFPIIDDYLDEEDFKCNGCGKTRYHRDEYVFMNFIKNDGYCQACMEVKK